MTRNLKVLGVALAAAFAMTAVMASAASATEFHAESAPVTLTGNQHAGEDEFITQGGVVRCNTATYHGTQSQTTTSTVQVLPKYSNCTALSGFASAQIHVNGCEYLFHLNATGTTGTTDIVCPPGKEITVTATAFGTNKCTVHVPPQAGLGTIEFTNVGSGTTREITVDVDITNQITYTQTAGSGFGACGSVETGEGDYIGAALVTGEEDEGPNHIGIFAG